MVFVGCGRRYSSRLRGTTRILAVVTGDFACVPVADLLAVLVEPVGEHGGRWRRCLGVGNQQSAGESLDLVFGENDVVEKGTEHSPGEVGQRLWRWGDPAVSADTVAYEPDQFGVGEYFGADGVDLHVVVGIGGFDGELGQVLDEHGLDAVVAGAGQKNDGEFPDGPGDVVEQNVLVAIKHGGAEDGVGDPADQA